MSVLDRQPRRHDRYSSVAIVLHWLIAGALAAQFMLGWRMGAFDGFTHVVLLQVHKSVGITILLLSLARLAWRLMNPPPALPSGSNGVERRIARWAHRGFYAALIILPLTGWAVASLGRPGGMKLFGLMPWPSLPGLARLPAAAQDSFAAALSGTHSALSWVMMALVALHVLGALKHHFITRDAILSRMAPGAKSGAWAEPRLAAIPLVAIGLALLVFLPSPQAPAARPKVTDVAKADVYLDVVEPALTRRCGTCHNAEEARGGLSLASYDDLMQGAADGPVIRPGDTAASELYRRISLPSEHERYMPKDGKTPLSKDEVAAIHWWIAQGAPKTAMVAQLKLTPQAAAALREIISADDSASGEISGRHEILPVVAAADPAVVAKLVKDGFVVRRFDNQSNLLEADYVANTPLTADVVADLNRIGPQLIRLNLRHAGVSDAMVATIAAFPNLRQLRLEANPVTDAGVADIARLKTLTYLNLANTKVTDAGIKTLTALPHLRHVYVWGTAVTPAAAEAMRVARNDLRIDAGLTAKDVSVETKVVAPVN